MAADTIAAIATATGRSGIGLIRISGTHAKLIAKAMCGYSPKPRVATLSLFKDKTGITIDQGLLIYFPAPHSFTGEHLIELHAHGNPFILDQLIQRCLQLGARNAEPGEFSKRAFLNGKIDLTQAEAIADLVDASSRSAARAAIRSLTGVFSNQVTQLLEGLKNLRLYVESAIDFPEEEIDLISEEHIKVKVALLNQEIKRLLAAAEQGQLLRDGMTIVIAGKPNAGKSSLLNALTGSDSAIVTPVAGTTRDLIKETIIIDGLPINIIDTAGLRETDDLVEQEGVRRAQQQIANADCVIHIIDLTEGNQTSQVSKLPETLEKITVYNKIDLINDDISHCDKNALYLSAKTGQGIQQLKHRLKQKAGYDDKKQGVFIARRRHLEALEQTRKHIHNGLRVLTQRNAVELLAYDLLLAQNALAQITGEFTSDDLLGEIFSSFCIGK